MSKPISSNPRRTTMLVGLTAAAVGVGVYRWLGNHDSRSSSPDPAPVPESDLWLSDFPKPDGSRLRMADFRGRGVVLNFWATWCPPCVREFPLLDQFHQTWSPRGWSVVALALDQPGAVQSFLAKLPVSFPIGVPGVEGLPLSRALGNHQGALPFTVAFDPKGAIKGRIEGEATVERLENLVRT